MKMVYLENVHFLPNCIMLEIVDWNDVKRYKKFYTDEHQPFMNDRIRLVEFLKQFAVQQEDPSLQSLLSDASYVTEKQYGINSWVRDDFQFSVVERFSN